MRNSSRTLMIAVLAALVFGGALGAQERDRRGELRGVFVRLAERRVGDRAYLGIVVRPFEREEHDVVLVPQEYEELAHSARMMKKGDRIELSYMTEHGEKWIDRIEVERRRDSREGDPDGDRRIEIRRQEIRQGPEPMDERREGERRIEIRREMRREGEPRQPRREGERRIVIRREGEPRQEAYREERRRREPSPHHELERLLRDVIARHMEHMAMELTEILAGHIGRMHEEIQELRAHTENMRMELEELRHENEMLRRRLREANEPPRDRDREARVRRDPEQRGDFRERQERDLRHDIETLRELDRRESRERDERRDREPDQERKPDSSE